MSITVENSCNINSQLINSPATDSNSNFKPSFAIPNSEAGDFWYKVKDYFRTPSELGKTLRTLAATPDLVHHFDAAAKLAIVEAFRSKDYSQHVHFIIKIFKRINNEQLNDVVKKLFESYMNENDNPQLLIKRLMSLFTLQKIEAIIKSEFPHLDSAAETVKDVANVVRRRYDEKRGDSKTTLLNNAKVFFINTLDYIVNMMMYIFQLKDMSIDERDPIGAQFHAEMRYRGFRDNLTLISGWLIALSIYTESLLVTCITVSIIAISCLTIGYVYFKWIKPCPNLPHPFRNLVEEALKGDLAPVYGREEEIQTLVNAICENNPSNVMHAMLLGQTGVGKNEIVYGLAHWIAKGDPRCKNLKGKKIFMVNTINIANVQKSSMIEMMKRLLKGYESEAIYFFDEFHSAFMNEKNEWLGEEFKTSMNPGISNFRYCIAATTDVEFKKYVENQAAILRRMVKIPVKPFEDPQIYTILSNMVRRDAQDLMIDEEAIKELAYIRSTDLDYAKCSQPSKSMSLLTRAFAEVRSPMPSETTKALQQLKDKRNQMECQHEITFGSDVLLYTDAGHKRKLELKQLDEEIEKLEKELDAEKAELDKFGALLRKRNALKGDSELTALRLAGDLRVNRVSEVALKEFILDYQYHQVAMDNFLKRKRLQITGAPVVISSELIRTIIGNDKKMHSVQAEEKERNELL